MRAWSRSALTAVVDPGAAFRRAAENLARRVRHDRGGARVQYGVKRTGWRRDRSLGRHDQMRRRRHRGTEMVVGRQNGRAGRDALAAADLEDFWRLGRRRAVRCSSIFSRICTVAFRPPTRQDSPCKISEELSRSIKTIESHRAALKDKLKLESGSDLVRFAVRWLDEG